MLTTTAQCDQPGADLDSDGVINLFDLDADNDGIPNSIEAQCDGNTIEYDWQLADNPATATVFTWFDILDGFDLDVTLTSNYPPPVTNGVDFPRVESGILELGMDVVDVNDPAQFSTFELELSNPMIISAITIQDIDNEGVFFGVEFSDGVALDFIDIYGNILPQTVTLGDALSIDADGFACAAGQITPVLTNENDNWLTYGTSEEVHIIRITYASKNIGSVANPAVQSIAVGEISFCPPRDSDNDGIPDYQDLDSDNDGIPDAIEACGDISLVLEDCRLDSNGDADYTDDTNGSIGCHDGLVSNYCMLAPIDTDGDGTPDYIDLDSDGDGCADSEETESIALGANILSFDNIDIDSEGLLEGVGCFIPSIASWIDASDDRECSCNLEQVSVEGGSYCDSDPGTGTLTITWTGGTAPFRVEGDLTANGIPDSQYTFDNLIAGQYNLTILDDNDCSVVFDVAEVIELISPTVSGTKADASCGSDNGTLMLTIVGGSGPYQVSGDLTATDVVNTIEFTDLASTTYAITITDQEGCGVEYSETINNTISPTLSSTASTPECGVDVGSAVLTWLDGNGPFSLEGDIIASDITSPYTTEDLGPGEYMVTLRDASDCTSSTTFTIEVLQGVTIEESVTPTTCGASNGSYTITVLTGQAPFTLLIDGMADIALNGNTTTITDLGAGSFQGVLRDMNGCDATVGFSIVQLDGPSLDIPVTSIECDDPTGTAEISWMGGEAPFDLSGDITQSDISSPYLVSDLAPGDYDLTLTDANGCPVSTSISIPELVSVSASVQTTCNDVNTYSAVITTDRPGILLATGYTIVQNSNTEYEITGIPLTESFDIDITATSGTCPSMVSVIAPNCTCSAQVSVPSTYELNCDDPSVVLDGSASSVGPEFSYAWIDEDGNVVSNEITYETSSSGIFTLEVTDNTLNCAVTADVTVQDASNVPVAEILANETTLTCNTSIITVSVTPQPNVEYEWTIPGQANTLIGDTQIVTDVGQVQLVVTDTNTGCTNDDALVIDIDTMVSSIVVVESQELTCQVNEVTLDASDSQSGDDIVLQWVDALGNPLEDEGILEFIVTSAGTYFIQSTNTTTGCSKIDSVEVVADESMPEIELVDLIMLPCNELSQTVGIDNTLPPGDYSYLWTVDGEEVGNDATIVITDVGIYTLLVTDNSTGCSTNESVDVMLTPMINDVEFTSANPSCFDTNDGEIDLVAVDGGVGPYTYYLEGSEVSLPLANLSAGEYVLDIVDANGCDFSKLLSLVSPPELTLTVNGGSEVTVPYGEDALIELITNADSPTVDWFPSISCDDCLEFLNENVTEDQEYTVTVTNEENCMVSIDIRLLVKFEEQIFMPNVLLFGSDHALLYPQSGDEDIYINEMSVYDRWGNKVFTSGDFEINDTSGAWDSTFDGDAAQPGVYVYHINYSHPQSGEVNVTGDVTLLR